ncbi:WD40 repeat domain-containing serine/threonine-protein kinase [Candidatus Uabimicrobium amorphum]|uniref:Protein kinase n=1 Tax=Uabimicrobium amorphum TaxID=2596890 RepID=A0A5S9IUB4_UABAM|nr:protein kinase [Candidatus Uabimicrobium amorphum]BBM87711.1 protein kinase [Candidatus Uabimicrobium amorphum]
MDKKKLQQRWKKLEEQEQQDPGSTYKSHAVPPKAKSSLPAITFSQQEMDELFSDQKIEEQNTVIDPNVFSYNSDAKPSNVNYDISEEIARGGMGVIYKAKQISLQREIAIKKLIDNDSVPHLKEKFINEAVVTAFLDHPNIVPVHELGQSENGDVILAMKLVGGTSWHNILLSPEYDLNDHLQILLSVCNAMAFAHSKQIIHNDLKPENIMIGEFGEVLVMDWGIAVDISEVPDVQKKTLSKHKIESPMGTPHYMPIELAQGKGKNIGPWTDIYLLGGILYEIITGDPPHMGKDVWEVVSCVLEGPKLQFPPKTPLELQEICHKALSKEFHQRYQCVHEFKKAIENFIKHRESNTISNKACEILAACEKKVVKVTSAQLILQKGERSQLYDQFAQSIARFQQAIELWKGNEIARDAMQSARLLYAKIALHNGDIGLAEAQISKITTPQVKELRKKINQQKISKLRQIKTTNNLRLSLKVSVIFIIIGLAASTVLIGREHLRAQQKAVEAIRLQQQKAKDARKSRIKLAKISMSKAREAQKRQEWDKLGAYAAEALEFIKDTDGANSQIENIQRTARGLIATAIKKNFVLWKSPAPQNILSQQISKLMVCGKYIVCAVEEHCYICDLRGKIVLHLPECPESIRDISMTSDFVAIVLESGSIQIWNLSMAKLQLHFAIETDRVFAQFAAKDLLVYNTATTVNTWDLKSNTHNILYYQENIDALSVSQSIVASNAKDGMITYDLQTATTTNHEYRAEHIAVYEKFVFAALDAQTAKLWSGATLLHSLHDENVKINAIALNATWLVTVFANRSIGLWDIQTGKQLSTTPLDFDVHKVKFLDEKNVIIITKDQQLKIWNCEHQLPNSIFPGHTQKINALEFSGDGETIASVSDDNTMRLWQTSTGKLQKTLIGHSAGVNCVAFSANATLLVSGSKNKDSTSKLWNLEENTSHTLFQHNNQDIYSVAFSEDDKMAAVGSAETAATIWDVSTRSSLAILSHPAAIRKLFFVKEQLVTVCGDFDNKIRWWDTKTHRTSFEVSIPGNVTAIALCKSNKMLALVVDHNKIYLWDTYRKTLANTLGPYTYAISTLSISQDMIAICTSKSTMELLSLKTGYPIKTIPTTTPMDCIALSPKDHVIAATANEQLQLWRIPARAHQSQPGKRILVNSSKKYIVSSLQNDVLIYDNTLTKRARKSTSVTVEMFQPHKNAVIANDDKQVVIWDLDEDEPQQTNIFGKFMSVSPSGNIMAINYGDADIGFFDVRANQDLGKIRLNAHSPQQILVKFVDEKNSVVATQDTFFLYDTSANQDIQTLMKDARAIKFTANIRSIKVFEGDIFVATQNHIYRLDKTLMTTRTITAAKEISHFAVGTQNIILAGTNGSIYVWNRKDQQFTHSFNASYGEIDDVCLLDDHTAVISANNYITRWSISPAKAVVYSTTWTNALKSKFHKENQHWVLETHLDFSPKATAQNLFGFSISDNLSTKKVSAKKYIFP